MTCDGVSVSETCDGVSVRHVIVSETCDGVRHVMV